MGNESDSMGERLLAAFAERESRFESALKEFRAELRAETTKVEVTARSIETSVHMIDKNLEGLKAEKLPEKIERLEGKHDRHDERIRVLENWRFYMMGGLAIIGTVVAILTTILIKKLF